METQLIRTNPSNLRLPDNKAANRKVAGKSAIVTKRNVNANSASARSRVAEANRAVAAKRAAAANKAAVSKAADDKPCPRIHNRREATPAAFHPSKNPVRQNHLPFFDGRSVSINTTHRTVTLISIRSMNRSIFYIIGVIVVVVIVLKLLGLF